MLEGSIFLVKEEKQFNTVFNVEFKWNSGYAKSQKQKNIKALHTNYIRVHQNAKLLEISTASNDKNGTKLSAFNLPITISGKTVCVEQAFQSGKVFQQGGPFPELLEKTPKDAKKIAKENLKNFGGVIGFELDGVKYPTKPETAFYDWIYITALKQNKELADYLLQFDGFTDIEFNSEKSINCQARSAAIYCGLCRTNKIDNIKTFEEFVKEVY